MIVRCALIWLLGASFTAFSQTEIPSLPPGHYVVVAAYLQGQESYVTRFTDKINAAGRHAKFGYDEGRKFYYVYLDQYDDFKESIRQMEMARAEFPRAWVRVMKGTPAAKATTETKPAQPAVAETRPEEKPVPVVVPATTETAPVSKDTAATKEVKDIAKVDVMDNPPADPVYRPQILHNTPVFLSLYNPTNHKVVEGEVEVIDTDRSKLIKKVKGNDYVQLPDPGNKSGQLTLISNSFGYRKMQHEINYKSTEKDTLQPFVSLVGNYYMISFDMIRLHRGDIATLYNVYFFNDAAIMLPESKYELNNLLQMMNENPGYRIRLHGHTNGRKAGKIITRGESNDFFQITADVKRGIGSAKDLSQRRAEAIRDWLIVNGITADRMEIKAWGGSRMIHDQNSEHARKNVRVEVEVLQE